MDKRIAIITGASGGIGREFCNYLYEEVDEIWAIARNQEKLDNLRRELGEKIRPISKDLTKTEDIRSIGKMLGETKVTVAYLINNAGVARMGSYEEFSVEEVEATIHINCSAVAVLCTICIPYMKAGSRILNVSSSASFQPLPYLNLYAATKVFVRSYSRSLNVELKGTGITVTAVCPGWVDTELLMKEINGVPVKFPGIVSAERVARVALKDAKCGRDMSVCSMYFKLEHVLTKIFSQKAAMGAWYKNIKKYGF